MKNLSLSLVAAMAALIPAGATASIIDQYSFSVPITGSDETNSFTGNTYTGAFLVDESSGDITNFSTDLLGSTYSAADLGNVAVLDGSGHVTTLSFQLTITAADGAHSSGFTAGFACGQITFLGLNCGNYFAFLDAGRRPEGGGTPSFSLIASDINAPEPGSLVLLSAGALAFARQFARKRQPVAP
jgi:hypothetical protein